MTIEIIRAAALLGGTSMLLSFYVHMAVAMSRKSKDHRLVMDAIWEERKGDRPY